MTTPAAVSQDSKRGSRGAVRSGVCGLRGLVILDTRERQGIVYWMAPHELDALLAGREPTGDADRYASFSDWVESCLEEAIDEFGGSI